MYRRFVIIMMLASTAQFALAISTYRLPKKQVYCKRIVHPDAYTSYAFHVSEACETKIFNYPKHYKPRASWEEMFDFL